jgi:pilus assembly protein CpaC
MAITRKIGILILFIAVAGATVLYAEEPSSVNLTVGRSTIVDVGAPIARVSLTSSDVADALVTSPAQLLIHGKTPGTISMFIWDRAGAIRRYDVAVQRDLSRLSTQLTELFPGEKITAQGNGRAVIVSGVASTKFIADKAVEVAAGYVDKKEDVVNLLQVGTATGPAQVLLRVRFAEVSRSALTELGASWFTSPTGVKNTLARVTTQQFSAPGFDELKWTKESSDFGSNVTSAEGKFTFSDFLNLFVFSEKYDIGAMIRLLQTKGVFQNLAEPNLVTESGKEASFLAGGEIPVPIAQGTGGNVAISVQWKEFGIRLNFTPTVNGDRVHLKVKPEVSTLDFGNAIVLQGFKIPALSTRRADTEIELRNGQTFAVAGLLNNTASQTLQKVPGIGDIPILGLLFKSKAAQKQQTELVVMITPEILPPTSQGITGDLPRLNEPYLGPMPQKKSFPSPPPAFQGSGSSGANVTPIGPNGSQPAPVAGQRGTPADPASAAAAVSALTPQAPKVVGTPSDNAAVQAPPPVAPAPLSKDEQKALERAQREELRLKAEQQKRDAKLAEEQQKRDREEQARQEKLAREQARRDAEQAKRDAEAAKRQAEIDKQRQKQVDEAAAKLKAAEQAYQAELAKRQGAESPK